MRGWLIPPLPVTVPPVPIFNGAEIAHCWRLDAGLGSPRV